MTNFQQLYEQEKEFRVQLQQDFDEYKEKSVEIEDYLESQINELSQSLSKKDQEYSDLKSKQQQQKTDSEKFIRQLEREVDSLRQKYEQLQGNHKKDKSKLVQLENENEYLESQNRALETMNSDLEQKIDSILEELALLQTELEDNRNNHQNDIENIERLKQQIRDTESELFAQQMKHQMIIGNQENNKNLSNFSTTRSLHNDNSNYSHASTSSTSSITISSIHQNPQKYEQNAYIEEDGDANYNKQRQLKKVRKVAQNMTYSFNPQQIDTLSKLYLKTQNEQKIQKANQFSDQNNNNQNNSISEKDSSSNNSSGKKEDSDNFTSEQIRQQRGRKLTSFTGFKAERYSEEKRRLQHKIIKEKINMYDKNISNLKLTELGFSKSLNLITNLIKDLDDKMVKIRSKKAQLGTPRNLSTVKKIQIEAQ